MTRNTLNALCLSLLSLLAIACGDAAGAPVEEDTDLGGVLAGEEGGNDDDAEHPGRLERSDRRGLQLARRKNPVEHAGRPR